MEAASLKFFRALGESHYATARAELLIAGETQINLHEAGVQVNGTVQVENADVQRSGSLELVDESGLLAPKRADDVLSPVGNEIRLWRGVRYSSPATLLDDSELVPIGTFRFTTTGSVYPKIDLTLFDRAWTIAGNKFEQSLTIAKGTNYVTAITTILQTAWGGALPTNFPNTDEVTPSMFFEIESDPWTVARQLAANIGMRLFFDPWGVCTMMPEPDGRSTTPVWTFDDADVRNFALPGTQLTWDASSSVNAVVAVGENSDNDQIYRGIARDLDPKSPTQWGGKFGRRQFFLRDEKITSQAQATLRAKKELRQRLGILQTVSVPSLVNPALACGDLVRVIDSKTGIDQNVIVDRFQVPLRGSDTTTLERTRLMPTEIA